ncbi:MAG TPA: DUF6351 family protein [Ramlibacter sp.]|uniref:DUF6351 family protein n=1 Tax=Ramlibacter sp. TaxID=1917967 RepID=UPI002ED13A76
MQTNLSTARARACRLAPCAAAAALLAACGGGGGSDGGANIGSVRSANVADANIPFAIRTVNNRADLVSGGDALFEITAPAGTIRSGVLTIKRNGVDVTGDFTPAGDNRLRGVVTGLVEGSNLIEATIRGGSGAQLEVTNAPRHGPVLSGAHVKPFHCATPVPVPGDATRPTTNASGLSGQPDANCNIATETTLYYRKASAPSNCTTSLPNPVPSATSCWGLWTQATPAADIASATTDHGVTVPYVVRLERGTMNRGIYDLAVLFDPAAPWTALRPQPQWNGKVYYSFGASTGQPRRQSRTTSTAWSALDEQLKRGFLVLGNSMSDSARNSNRVLMSETVMMMKEHIADTYGPIKYTLGNGCSGGSINSNMNASIGPGLLDGIITSCTYPDSETTSMEVGDCTLLVEAYQRMRASPLWSGLTQAAVDGKKAAINGHVDPSVCHAWFNAFGSNGKAGVYTQRLVATPQGLVIDSPAGPVNNCELPNTAVYDPRTPETRAATEQLPRCNAWSWAESIWGRVPGSFAARDTRDNEGVQYGLKALRDGAITPEEFVALNEAVGGIDRDSTPRAQRSQADVEALETAYRSGIVASGKQLAKTPIIDLRGWDDSNVDVPPGQTANPNPLQTIPIHHQWFSWAVRDRIQREYGDFGNQALWRFARTGLAPTPATSLFAFNSMDTWLTKLVTDTSGAAIEQKVRAARPADTADFCLLPEDATQSLANRVTDMAACDANKYLKPSLSPRQVAGGPRAEDILKCQLKPLDGADYGAVGFSATQWSRLQAVFATGVCDWSKPGVGQQLAVSPLTFQAGAGGQPLPPAPMSTKK